MSDFIQALRLTAEATAQLSVQQRQVIATLDGWYKEVRPALIAMAPEMAVSWQRDFDSLRGTLEMLDLARPEDQRVLKQTIDGIEAYFGACLERLQALQA